MLLPASMDFLFFEPLGCGISSTDHRRGASPVGRVTQDGLVGVENQIHGSMSGAIQCSAEGGCWFITC